jgi:hypothetical protein
LSPTNKPTDWNVVITEKALLEAMRTPSPPPEEIQHSLATLYNNTFPTHEKYHEFTVNCLTMWGNTLDYKLFNTLYMTHQYHSYTIKKLREQAMALLEEANKINKQDMMVRHEIESHVRTISRSDLQQRIRKPQQVWVVVSPTPLPSTSRQSNNSHCATYGRDYAQHQYQCFECRDPTHFKWSCCYDFEQCVWVKPVLVFGTERNSIVNSHGLGLKHFQRSSQVRVRWASQRVPLRSGIVLESLRTSYLVDQTKF